VTAAQVGELLYRTALARSQGARVLGSYAGARGSGTSHEGAARGDRPYPRGGSSFELELYLTVWDCVGLERGVYHYDPFAHSLGPIDTDRITWQELLGSARMAADADDSPQVLITMTARFRQSSWRLEGSSYRLVLMSAGALMQSLYLVSTAMCLAPCAVGAVGPDAVARALGIDWRIEPCVGHFMVGTYPAASDVPVVPCMILTACG
jgi:SagB-type dehydrogenase family enzyme